MSLALAMLLGVAAIAGRASVIDGDTLEVHGTRIRLHGIDAPESDQVCTRADGRRWRCGQQAALALDAFLAGRTLSCESRDVDRYKRVVAECFVADESVNAWMVRNGWAVAYRQFTDAYVAQEQLAVAKRLNIWSGTFEQPAQHRQGERGRRPGPPSAPDPACAIKGNISADGTRIYHSPGQRDYDRVVIDRGAGEKWFCSAAQAEAAGWRAARR